MATILELAKLSNAAYETNPVIGTTPVSGWTIIATRSLQDGYQGVVYQNGAGQIVIANRGTRPTSLTDLLSDLKLAAGGTPPVENDAAAFALSIANNPLYAGQPIIETGHSLGGAEAQAATVALTDAGKLVSAVTFNSPGIASSLVTNAAASYKVLNLYDQGDAIHLAGEVHLGSYGKNGLVMIPAGPSTSSLVLSAPFAIAAGALGIGALVSKAIWNIVGPAHSIEKTVIPYLNTNAMGLIGWSAAGPSLPIVGGTQTGPTMSVNAAGALVITDAGGDSVVLTSSADQQSILATFNGSGTPIFQQLTALGTVTFPASELNQVVTGLTGAATINETITRNPNNTNTFDVAFQNAGAFNSGDQFIVNVTNPGSAFNYVVPTNTQALVETIDNGSNNASGTISVIGSSTTQLTGGTTMVAANTWTDGNGDQYVFDPIKGTLTITQGLLVNAGDQIVIDNFDMNAAQTTNGYMGIKFNELLALMAGTSPTGAFSSGVPINQTASVNGNTQTFTLSDLAASTTAQTVTLSLSGGSGTYYISTGANDIPLTGPVTLVIPAGQDSATYTLIDTSNSGTTDTAILTASLTDANGTATSNNLTVNFNDTLPAASSADNTINGKSGNNIIVTGFSSIDAANDCEWRIAA